MNWKQGLFIAYSDSRHNLGCTNVLEVVTRYFSWFVVMN